MKQWVVETKEKDFDGLSLKEAPVPKAGDYEVLVKLHAASLNYRDLIIPKVMRIRHRFTDVRTDNSGTGQISIRCDLSCHSRIRWRW